MRTISLPQAKRQMRSSPHRFGLLVFALACNPEATPVTPNLDPLEGVSTLVLEGPTEPLPVGAFVHVRLLNGSTESVTAANSCWRFDIERQDADTWVVLPNGIFGCAARAPMMLPPGQIYEETLRLPEDGEPGPYRIAFPHSVGSRDELVVTVSTAFQVQPSGVAANAP